MREAARQAGNVYHVCWSFDIARARDREHVRSSRGSGIFFSPFQYCPACRCPTLADTIRVRRQQRSVCWFAFLLGARRRVMSSNESSREALRSTSTNVPPPRREMTCCGFASRLQVWMC